MKIISLTAENVLRLSAVEITPEGNLICIGGDNAQGKSSVLSAIEMALGGGEMPDKPIRNGAAKGRVCVDLGDLIVERTFTEKGTSLSVKSKDGLKYSSPQKVLDGFVGRLSFDPLAFRDMKPADQKSTLQQLIGLDLSPIDRQRQIAFDKRTEVNRRVKDLRSQFEAASFHEGVPEAEVSIADLISEKDRLAEENVSREKVAGLLATFDEGTKLHEAAIVDAEQDVIDAEQALADAKAMVEKLKSQRDKRSETRVEMASNLEAMPTHDISELNRKIGTAEETNAKVRANASRRKLESDLRTTEKQAEELTQEIADAEQQKADCIAAAKLPVDGLGFDETGVTFGGIPFAQASATEALQVSAAIGIALNPKLKVMLIRNPAYIGERYLKLLAEMAVAADMQVWLERGGDGPECCVVIEDGRVKADEPAEELAGASA